MTSTKVFTNEFQQKIRSAFQVLNALNEKEPQQIIHVLKEESNICAVTISKELNTTPSIVQDHLQSLKAAKLLKIQEKEDQSFFSLDHDRLARISLIVKGLART